MRTGTYVAAFLLCLTCACASHPAPPAQIPQSEVSWITKDPVAVEAPPPAAGDIQFTVTSRKAKAAPAEEEGAPIVQPLKANSCNTTGVTSTGVLTQQHVHAAQ